MNFRSRHIAIKHISTLVTRNVSKTLSAQNCCSRCKLSFSHFISLCTLLSCVSSVSAQPTAYLCHVCAWVMTRSKWWKSFKCERHASYLHWIWD